MEFFNGLLAGVFCSIVFGFFSVRWISFIFWND